MSTLRWLAARWYIPLLFLSLVLGFLFAVWFRRRPENPVAVARRESQALEAQAQAQRWEAQLGAEKAKAMVQQEYETQLQQLNEKQKEEAHALEEKPADLARYLVRVGGRPLGG